MCSFLWMSNIPLCICKQLLHPSIDGHLGSFHVLAIVNSVQWTMGYMCLFQFWFPQGICLGGEFLGHQFSSVQTLSRVWLFATPWTAARQASLSIINSRSSLTLMSIESVMPSSHLILCHPLLLLPPIPLSIRVFSNGSTLHMRWPKYWSFMTQQSHS